MTQFVHPKGHDKCQISSGICEGTTFGTGKLDDYGYWEFPCAVCAREYEKQFPQFGSAWPYKPEDIKW